MSSTETESDLSDFSDMSSSEEDEEDEIIAPIRKRARTRGGIQGVRGNFHGTRPIAQPPEWLPWETAYFEPDIPPFTGIPGPTTEPLDTVVQYVELFLTDAFVEYVMDQTNLYAAQFLGKVTPSVKSRANEWKDVTIEEIRKYISLTILMGVHTLPSVPDYWSTNILKYNPVYNNKMSRNRYPNYFRILAQLHLSLVVLRIMFL